MKNAAEILARYMSQDVGPEEQDAIEQWFMKMPAPERDALLEQYGELVAALPELETQPDKPLLQRIRDVIRGQYRGTYRLRRWSAAAAAVLILAVAGIMLWKDKDTADLAQMEKIPPGKQGAILTLADGREVLLDSLNDGLVAEQSGANAMLGNGQLHYRYNGKTSNDIAYNTMTTPKGRQFRLQLPDGTEVWLNAASSIRFPTAFTGKTRSVSVSGEVYFKVAAKAGQPFTVDARGKALVEVLGTRFNINTYEDAKTLNTTLLEGAIRVNSVVLKPGQQAQIGQQLKVVDDANIEQAIAWTNGLFNFDNISLQEAMHQIERWYDIEVVYEDDDIPEIPFGGEIKRNLDLPDLLKLLESTNLTFSLENRTLKIRK